MAQTLPDAIDPRPATLADHDWLINERGVATIEPFDGGEVHGVLWQVTDHDLVELDSAEGVPVRYRRDRLTVHTDAGRRGLGLRRPPGRTGRTARDPATWNVSSTAPCTMACPSAGSTSCDAGIPRTGRASSANGLLLRRNRFQSCWPIPASSRTAPCVRGSDSSPSTVAAWNR